MVGSDVLAVGIWPTPAPRMLHQFEQSWRISVTPERPVSMSQCGVKLGMAAAMALFIVCT